MSEICFLIMVAIAVISTISIVIISDKSSDFERALITKRYECRLLFTMWRDEFREVSKLRKEVSDLRASKQALLNSVCYHLHRADEAEAKIAKYDRKRGDGGKFVKRDGKPKPKSAVL